MLKSFTATAVIALGALFVGGSQAQAQYAPIADAYLQDGFYYATVAFVDSGTADGYDAYIDSYFAQYFSSVGEFYYATVYAEYAANSAWADYQTTGDPAAYYAYQFLSTGAGYAYDAFLGY